MKFLLFLFFLLANLVLFSGCTFLKPQTTTHSTHSQAQWLIHQAHLRELQTWRLNGSISITQGEDNWQARVYWQQQEARYQLRFNAPLGQGAMQLEGDENQVILRTAHHETFTAQDPDALLAEILELEVPVLGLQFWIRGLPQPDRPYQKYELKDNGYLQTLEQNGWQIEYGEYMPLAHIQLPKKIFLDNDQLEVKIVISHWDIKKPTDLIQTRVQILGYDLDPLLGTS